MSTNSVTPDGFVLNGRDIVLSIAAINALAVAQPLMDLLGRNPGFFLARNAPALDIGLFAVGLGIAIPFLAGLIVYAIHIVNPKAGRAAHVIALALLGMVLTMTIAKQTPVGQVSAVVVGVGAVAGATLAWSYFRFSSVRTTFRYAAVAPFAVASAFLFVAPTSQLVWTFDSSAGEPFSSTVGRPAPVVMVVFDELPLASLIDAEGRIQSHFPNFARLAEGSTWFRNAVGVHNRTQEALPAIVSGVLAPVEGKHPSASDYPYTIFSLVEGSYEVNAVETVTELCPDTACEGRSRRLADFGTRWKTLASDLGIVSGHLFLPVGLSEWLPPVDENWGGFAGTVIKTPWGIRPRVGELLEADRRTDVARFLGLLIHPLSEGDFFFAHLMLPHWPWIHLPDGRLYTAQGSLPGLGRGGWSSDEWLVAQAYQRHLLQVKFADDILGQILEQLDIHGSYDEALIVVLADHGGTIRPDTVGRRAISHETVGDIAAIPLFIKRPNQANAVVDDYRAETIDVLPTVADVLRVSIPWRVDGVSLFSEGRPKRTQSTMFALNRSVTFGVSGNEKLEVASYHWDFFEDRGPFGIAPIGYATFLGRDIATTKVTGPSSYRVELDQPELYTDVDINADFVPALLQGRLIGGTDAEINLAIAVNGRVAAVTRTWHDGAETRFQAIIPPDALVDGNNDIDVLMIEGSGGERQLSPLAPAT